MNKNFYRFLGDGVRTLVVCGILTGVISGCRDQLGGNALGVATWAMYLISFTAGAFFLWRLYTGICRDGDFFHD